MANKQIEAEKLEEWIDDAQTRIFQSAVVNNTRRRSSVIQSKDFANMIKDIKTEYKEAGFDEKLDTDTLEKVKAKKPLSSQKKGNLKEKNETLMKLLNVVEEKTDAMNDAWEHFASADGAFSALPSYRNPEKSCPAQGVKSVPYNKEGLDEGMDMFEKQFDGVMNSIVKTCEKDVQQ